LINASYKLNNGAVMKLLRILILILTLILFILNMPAFASDIYSMSIAGDTRAIELLLKEGADINAVNLDGMSGLMLACVFKRFEAVKLHVKSGAHVNACTPRGDSALVFALESNDFDCVSYLIDNSAEVEVVESSTGRNALMMALEKNAPLWLIIKLIESGANLKYSDPTIENQILPAAVWSNNKPEIIKKLIDAGAEINAKDRGGKTALMYACVLRSATESVELLLESGADVNIESWHGDTAYSIASAINNVVALELLEKTGALNESTTVVMLEALLTRAVIRDETAEALALLRKDVSPNVKIGNIYEGERQISALYYAVNNRRYDMVKILLEHGANVFNLYFADFDNAFEVAVTAGCERMVELFLKHGQNYSPSDSKFMNIFSHAIFYGNPAILKLLISKGADVNFKYHGGKTPLHLAVDSRNSQQTAKTLIASGACIDAADAAGDTPLIMAARKKVPEFLLTLIEAGADIHLKNNAGMNAIMEAFTGNSWDYSFEYDQDGRCAEILLNKGARLDFSNRSNNSKLLYKAVSEGDIGLAKKIIESGVDVNALSDRREPPLAVAVYKKKFDMVKLLVEAGADINYTGEYSGAIFEKALLQACGNSYGNENGRKIAAILLDSKVKISENCAKKMSLMTNNEKNYELVKLMLARGVPVDTPDSNGITPLLNSITRSLCLKMVKLLVESGADVNARSPEGDTPLLLAASINDRKLFDYLISKGADEKARDNKGRGVVLRAINGGLSDYFLKYILKKGYDANLCDFEGNNALISAIILYQYQCGTSELKLVELLAGKTKNIRHKNKKGESALLLAYEYNLPGFIKLLKKYGALDDYSDALLVNSMLVYALYSGDIRKADLLIEKGGDVNRLCGGEFRKNYLICGAVKRGDIAMTKLLIERGARLVIEGEYTTTDAFMKAVEYKQIDILKYFISRGIDINQRPERQKSLVTAIIDREGDLALIELLLSCGGKIDYCDHESNNLIHISLNEYNSSVKFIDFLIGRGAVVNHVNKNGDTPIFRALSVSYYKPGVLETLIKNGADLEVKNAAGETPLLKAALNADTCQVGLLKKYGAAIDYSNKKLLDALFYCYAMGDDTMEAAALLERGANAHAKLFFETSILHNIIAAGRIEMVKLLMARDVSIKFDSAFYASGFFPAIYNGNTPVVKFFVERGADIEHKGQMYETPIAAAVRCGKVDIVEYLIGRGAQYKHIKDLLVTAMKNTAPKPRMAKLLIDAGIDINAVDKKNQNALIAAISPINESCIIKPRSVDSAIIKLLIEKGIEVNAVDDSGRTALAIAERAGLKDIVKILKKVGAKQ